MRQIREFIIKLNNSSISILLVMNYLVTELPQRSGLSTERRSAGSNLLFLKSIFDKCLINVFFDLTTGLDGSTLGSSVVGERFESSNCRRPRMHCRAHVSARRIARR